MCFGCVLVREVVSPSGVQVAPAAWLADTVAGAGLSGVRRERPWDPHAGRDVPQPVMVSLSAQRRCPVPGIYGHDGRREPAGPARGSQALQLARAP